MQEWQTVSQWYIACVGEKGNEHFLRGYCVPIPKLIDLHTLHLSCTVTFWSYFLTSFYRYCNGGSERWSNLPEVLDQSSIFLFLRYISWRSIYVPWQNWESSQSSLYFSIILISVDHRGTVCRHVIPWHRQSGQCCVRTCLCGSGE